MSHVRLFISAVSNEFGGCREALRHDLDRSNVTVKIQEDFKASGTVTLDKLDNYIRSCEAVIHLAGDMTGAMANVPSVDLIRERYPDMVTKLPALQGAFDGTEVLSYTQWEAWLAIYHGKPLFIAVPEPTAPRDEKFKHDDQQTTAQKEHLERLRKAGRYPEIRFANTDRLIVGIVTSALINLLPPREKTKPIHLPYRSLGTLFKGRDVFMAQLQASLLKTTAKPQTSAIVGKALYGLGGIGKTRLAVEYAWQRKAEYSAVLFVIADTPESLRSNVAVLCGPMTLNLPEHTALEEEIKIAAVLRWLQNNPGWLLILDNVDTPEAATAAEKILAHLHGGDVLVTSRISQWSGQVERLELDVLSVEAAIDFLLERTGDSRRKAADDREMADKIAHELGQLALALEQAGAYISVHQFTLAQYAKAWRANHDKIMGWFDERQMQYPKSVAITWHTSFSQLSEPARRLMSRLAWLSPEPIPESLLEEPVPNVEQDDDSLANLSELARYSLVTRAKDVPAFTVHRLVQDVTCSMMNSEAKIKALRETLQWVDSAFKGSAQDVRSWPVLEPLLPHALKVAHVADKEGLAALVGRLLNQLGLLLMVKAQHREAEPLMRRALEIDEQSFGINHPNVARDLNSLAQLLQDTNRLAEAEPLMRRALEIDKQSSGIDHPNVARDLNNLALLLQDTNRLSEAEPLMRRALEIDEQSFGIDHPDLARDLNNLAQLLKATNRLAEAEPLMSRVVIIFENSYGKCHPNVAAALNNLAQLLQATNRLTEAEPLMRRALEIDEQSFGINHPNVAIRLNNLAQLLQETNRLTEAEPLIRRALEIGEQSFGINHPKVAIRLNNLALLLQDTNRLSEAEPLMRRALEIDELSLGIDHPNVARDLNNLAQLLQATNRLTEAEPLMRRALEIDEQSFGIDHPNVAIRLNNLAQLLQATNRLSEAEPLMRRALEIDEQSFGINHPNVARDLNNLAQVLRATNRLTEAEPLMRQVVGILVSFNRSTGHHHPRLQAAVNNYYYLLQEIGKNEQEINTAIKPLLNG